MLRIAFCLLIGLYTLVWAQESHAPWLKTSPNTIAGYDQAVEPNLSAGQYLVKARQLAGQAQQKRIPRFADKPAWRAAILNAETAARLNPTDPETIGFLAELYTQTQWWKRAYLAWRTLRIHRRLSDKEREMAALSAGRVGYSYYRQGRLKLAIPYLEASLGFRPNPEVQKLLDRARAKTVVVISL
jgi:tetratricopeptide (TPR) repeat protein